MARLGRTCPGLAEHFRFSNFSAPAHQQREFIQIHARPIKYRISPQSKSSFIKQLNCLIMNQNKHPICKELVLSHFFMVEIFSHCKCRLIKPQSKCSVLKGDSAPPEAHIWVGQLQNKLSSHTHSAPLSLISGWTAEKARMPSLNWNHNEHQNQDASYSSSLILHIHRQIKCYEFR